MLRKHKEGQVLRPNGVFTMWQTWSNITNEHYSLKQADQIKNKTVSNAISKTRYIKKYITFNVLWKHIHVTSLTDNIQTNIKVMINTKWEQLAVELNLIDLFSFQYR